MFDEITEKERAAWRHLTLKVLRSDGIIGIQWKSMMTPHGLMWRMSIHLFWRQVCITRMTFLAYRRHLLSLGPYRDC